MSSPATAAGSSGNAASPAGEAAASGRVIAISNHKGGVAKTSTCLNLGVSLSLLNRRVLLVDLDPQSNLTIALGYEASESVYDALKANRDRFQGLLQKTRYQHLWLVPSSCNLALLATGKSQFNDLGRRLREQLNAVKDRFDYILIDTPPSLESTVIPAVLAADFVIIPSQCEYLSTHGIDRTERFLQAIGQQTGQVLDYGILMTMYDQSNTSANVIYAKLRQRYNGRAFSTFISRDAKMQESQILNLPVIYHDRHSRSAAQYLDLAREIMAAGKPVGR
jgi:chromosome partitioning protein